MTNKKKFDLSQSAVFSQIETPEAERVIEYPEAKKLGRPRNERIVRDNPRQEGLTADYTRATFIVKVDYVETLKDYAYTERLSLKDVINDILGDYIEKNIDKSKLLHKPDNVR